MTLSMPAAIDACARDAVDRMGKLTSLMTCSLDHRYFMAEQGTGVHGAEVPGVTEILDDAGLIQRFGYTAEHAQRGSDIDALACHTVEHGPQLAVWPEAYRHYGLCLIEFLNKEQPLTIATQLRVLHPRSHYAGTLDWLCVLRQELWVIDFKAGVQARWHALQTAAYADALQQVVLPPTIRVRRGALYLGETTRETPFRAHYLPDDFHVFNAALCLRKFKAS